MKKRLLIKQPGKNGDILICLPIAKWYSLDYNVFWLCPKEFHNNFRNIDYCYPVDSVIEETFDQIIDMSFGLITNTELHKHWIDTRERWQSFVILKYLIAKVPLMQRWNLLWHRDLDREEALYNWVITKYGTNYNVVQQSSDHHGIDIDVPNKVIFEPKEDYNIFDWYKVLLRANSIHCIDSCLCNFVEVVPDYLNISKYYYATAKVPNIWDRTLLVNNWRFL